MANLTKRDIVVKISNETGVVQHQVFEIIQKAFDLITESLASGDDVELRNFGTFEVRLTKARMGRNPNLPGSQYPIPSRTSVKFKAGKMMKDRVAPLAGSMKRAQAEAES
jgi:nucleoid DNA-binding protein